MDVDLLWFGIFVVFMGELAILTPPIGILSFIVHGIVRDPKVSLGQKITLNDVFAAVWWFMPMNIVICVLLIFFPEIATFLVDEAAAK